MKCASPVAGLLAGLSLCCLFVSSDQALGQQSANVSVYAGVGLGAIPGQAFGVNTAVWDNLLLDTSVPSLLKQAGVTMLRFPGGSTSDVYHWQNNSATAGTGQYINASDTFDNFMSVAHNSGATPIITVNYGSSADGTAGGDPNEAAAWVQYANVTKGYGVQYWEIGNEIYGNGEYGGQWETDLHSDHSPVAYATNAISYITAMKLVDPTIKVGVTLVAPGNWPDGQYPDWNSNVLAVCGNSIDFVIVHWYPQGPGSESDAGLLGAPGGISWMVSQLRSLINTYCGANAPNVQILVTETNSVSYNPGKQTTSLVNALFLADNFMTWLENDVTSIDWWDLHNGMSSGNSSPSLYGSTTYGDYGMLATGQIGSGVSEPPADTPFPAYRGLKMLTYLGRPGDQMVYTSSNQGMISAHAVRKTNAKLNLLLINKDPSNSYSVNISLSGYTPAGAASVVTYGVNTSSPTNSTISGVSGSFTLSVPPYSLTTVLMSPVPPEPAAFMTSAAVSPFTVAAGGKVTIKTKVTDFGGTLINGIVDVEVYNSAGNKVGQSYYTGQSFRGNQSINYSTTWTTPSASDVYTVKIGVFGPNWSSLYTWNNGAASFTAIGLDTSQYNFETDPQGWASSGGMISGVSSSTAQSYAGTHSLAVAFNGSGADIQQVYIGSPSLSAGQTITFHVWFPAGSPITAIQPYVQQSPAANYAWTGNYQPITNLRVGTWNTITVTVPSNAVTPLYQLGVQFFTSAAWSGTCYVDAVSW